MSLDVYLSKVKPCPNCGFHLNDGDELYWSNITHNLSDMAVKAGIYEYLWHPENKKITAAKQLIKPLEKGLKKLKEKPNYFKKFDAKNGWGLYEHFVPWLEAYLEACKNNPNAFVRVSR